MTKPTLLPCPICGAQAEIPHKTSHKSLYWRIGCSVTNLSISQDRNHTVVAWGRTRKEVKEVWNKRISK